MLVRIWRNWNRCALMMQLLWKTVRRLHKTIQIELPYSLSNLTSGISPKGLEAGPKRDIRTPVLITAWLTIAKMRNPATCCNPDESWGYYVKWNKQVTKKVSTAWFHLCEFSKVAQFIVRKSRMVVTRCWRERERESCCLMGTLIDTEFEFCKMRKC